MLKPSNRLVHLLPKSPLFHSRERTLQMAPNTVLNYLCGWELCFNASLRCWHLCDSGLEASNFLLSRRQLTFQRRLLSLQCRTSKLRIGKLTIQAPSCALQFFFLLTNINNQSISSLLLWAASRYIVQLLGNSILILRIYAACSCTVRFHIPPNTL